MLLKRFGLHKFVMVRHELIFLHTSMGVGSGARIWKFQQKRLFS